MKEAIIPIGKRPAVDTIVKELGIGLIGAEIGVNKGYNASYICHIIQPKMLHLIDPWNNFFDPASGEIIGEAQYLMANALLQQFNCCKIIRKTSAEAINEFDNESLDFVYIDADHSYNAVLSDLTIWYPKIKRGGILSGHDFQQVKEAIVEFSRKNRINKLHTQDQDWWFRK